MAYSKRLTASLFLLQVLFTQAKGSCKIINLGAVLECSGEDITDLRSALGEVKEFPDADIPLYVESTGLTEIHENTTTRLFKKVTILDNKNLTTINPRAFELSSSVESLEIIQCPKLTNSVWELVSKMSAIKQLYLKNAGLTTVPVKAFEECKSINRIKLPENAITRFDASLGGLNLKELDLHHNQLTNDSFAEGVFEGKGHIEELILWGNQGMTKLKESHFKGLLVKGTRIYVGKTQFGDTYMECKGADWLCAKKEKKEGGGYLHETVFGYKCVEAGFHTIVDYCKSLR